MKSLFSQAHSRKKTFSAGMNVTGMHRHLLPSWGSFSFPDFLIFIFLVDLSMSLKLVVESMYIHTPINYIVCPAEGSLLFNKQ